MGLYSAKHVEQMKASRVGHAMNLRASVADVVIEACQSHSRSVSRPDNTRQSRASDYVAVSPVGAYIMTVV